VVVRSLHPVVGKGKLQNHSVREQESIIIQATVPSATDGAGGAFGFSHLACVLKENETRHRFEYKIVENTEINAISEISFTPIAAHPQKRAFLSLHKGSTEHKTNLYHK
jgi:hypothetical protein